MLDSLAFAKRVSLLRKGKKYTQEQLGKILGITPQAVSRWEQGSALPDIALLPELAETLSVTTDYLLKGKDTDEFKSPYDAQYEQQEYYWGIEPSALARQTARLWKRETIGRVLDIGSGEGRDAVYFAKQGFSVDALEISAPGIEKIKRYSQDSHCSVNAIHADMLNYEMIADYDIVYSSGTLQFLPVERRKYYFQQYKKHTRSGGIHAHLVFVEKPFVKTAPDWEPEEDFYQSGDLAAFYADWEILAYDEEIIDCNSSGVPHQHVICSVIARKP